MLEEKIYGMNEWNNKIVPLIKNNTLKNISNELPTNDFLIAGFCFEILVQDTDGKKYLCSGNWMVEIAIVKLYK